MNIYQTVGWATAPLFSLFARRCRCRQFSWVKFSIQKSCQCQIQIWEIGNLRISERRWDPWTWRAWAAPSGPCSTTARTARWPWARASTSSARSSTRSVSVHIVVALDFYYIPLDFVESELTIKAGRPYVRTFVQIHSIMYMENWTFYDFKSLYITRF